MFYLKKQDGTLFYLLNKSNKEHTVGRKDCDLLITNDQSISRKHALLLVSENGVILRDCGSRYNTFIENSRIDANINRPLKVGETIRFGVFGNVYRLHVVNIITTTSAINSYQRLSLKNNIEFLSGSLIPNWNYSCTHVTVEEIMLTVKVLCAIISGRPIVTLKYWEDYVNNVKQNIPPPDMANYKPSFSEIIPNYQDSCLDYKEERSRLFNNKTFVFPTERIKDEMVDVIELAGGEAISWDLSPLTKEQIDNSSREYLILQTNGSDETPSSELLDITVFLRQKGKRTIPLKEIALAIITCSCEKNCNPDFDRRGTVLAVKSQTQSYTMGNVIANDTESLKLFLMASQSVEIQDIIPQSLDVSVKMNSSIDIKDSFEIKDLNIKDSKDVKSIKREGDSLDMKTKRFKSDIPVSANIPRRINSGIGEKVDFKNEVEELPTRKTLFSFKNEEPSVEETFHRSSLMILNPFAKSKGVQNKNENTTKKNKQSQIVSSNPRIVSLKDKTCS